MDIELNSRNKDIYRSVKLQCISHLSRAGKPVGDWKNKEKLATSKDSITVSVIFVVSTMTEKRTMDSYYLKSLNH